MSYSNNKFKKGFTLIELLIVVGIIGVISAVVLANLNGARTSASDKAIKADLMSAANQAEIYYGLNNSYGAFSQATCPTSTGGGTNIYQNDTKMLQIIRHAFSTGSGTSSCYSTSEAYAISIGLKTTGQSLCVDNTKIVRQTTGTPAAAISGGLCI